MKRWITVSVVAADGLIKRDVFRRTDPFAVVSVDEAQRHTTSILKTTLAPYWNEHFYVEVTSHSIVAVQVFDQSRSKKNDQGFLGAVNITVGDYLDLTTEGAEMLCVDLKKANDIIFQGKIIINLSTKVTNNAKTPLTEAGASADVLQVQVASLNLHDSSAPSSAAAESTAILTPQIHRTLSVIAGSEGTGVGSPASSRAANDTAALAQTFPSATDISGASPETGGTQPNRNLDTNEDLPYTIRYRPGGSSALIFLGGRIMLIIIRATLPGLGHPFIKL